MVKNNNNSNNIIIFLIIIVIILIIAGLYIFMKKRIIENFPWSDGVLVNGVYRPELKLNSNSFIPFKPREGDPCWQSTIIGTKLPLTASKVQWDKRGYAHCNTPYLNPKDKNDYRFMQTKR